MRILVVEDDRALRVVVDRFLGRHGHASAKRCRFCLGEYLDWLLAIGRLGRLGPGCGSDDLIDHLVMAPGHLCGEEHHQIGELASHEVRIEFVVGEVKRLGSPSDSRLPETPPSASWS